MYYPVSSKFSIEAIVSGNWASLGKLVNRLVQKSRLLLLSDVRKEKEFESMLNTMDIKLPVNQRSWNRNSALIVYSKYHKSN